MNKTDKEIAKNIIRKVFGHVGFVFKPVFGKFELSRKEYKTSDFINVKTDITQRKYPIFSGECGESQKIIFTSCYLDDSDEENDCEEFFSILQINGRTVGLYLSKFNDVLDEYKAFELKNDEWTMLNIRDIMLIGIIFSDIADCGTQWLPRFLEEKDKDNLEKFMETDI